VRPFFNLPRKEARAFRNNDQRKQMHACKPPELNVAGL
jgi:hypothetical protein